MRVKDKRWTQTQKRWIAAGKQETDRNERQGKVRPMSVESTREKKTTGGEMIAKGRRRVRESTRGKALHSPQQVP